ncbi:MAG: PDZ domain-containing protein [Sedimentisphaerales bacterium]|nr:PDZ domain-containing protein [Sedimentisphaerales bacterium]
MPRCTAKIGLLALAMGLLALGGGCRTINKRLSEAVQDPGKAKQWSVHYGSHGHYQLDNDRLKGLEFEGCTEGDRIKVHYQRGLAESAQCIADETTRLLEAVEQRLGLTITTRSTIPLLRFDEIPQNFDISLKGEPNEFPLPLFVQAGDESCRSILAQNRSYPYLFVHELVETSLACSETGGRVLPDMGWSFLGLHAHVDNHTRWFREGLANYAGYIAHEIARQDLADAKDAPAGRALVHSHPFSALDDIGVKLFSWSQYSRARNQEDHYNAALGLFLLIADEYGEQAIREIMAEIAKRKIVDGRDLLEIAKQATGTDLKQLAAAFRFPQTGLKLDDLTAATALNKGLDVRRGLLVEALEPNGLADQAGLEPNDVIVAIDDNAVADELDYELALFKARARPSVSLSLWRAGTGTLAIDLPLWPGDHQAPEPGKRRNPLKKGRIDFVILSVR